MYIHFFVLGFLQASATVAPEASPERVSSGVEQLDAMLGGGYFRGSSVLITGSEGTGKSILAGAFAEAACLRKEQTLYVSFDENPSEVVRDLSSVGIRLGPHVKSGVLGCIRRALRRPARKCI
jgi:circadian clock protein KaiC